MACSSLREACQLCVRAGQAAFQVLDASRLFLFLDGHALHTLVESRKLFVVAAMFFVQPGHHLAELGQIHANTALFVEFDNCVGLQENNALADVRCPVGEAFEVVGHPQQIGRSRTCVGQSSSTPGVHGTPGRSIGQLQCRGRPAGVSCRHVALDEGVNLAHRQITADFCHPWNVDQRFEQGLIGQEPRKYRNTLAVVGHAFELRSDHGHGEYQAQIVGHRLLARNQQQAGLFYFPLRLIDQQIARDDFFGQFFVVIGKRLDGLLLQLVHHRCQIDQLLFDMRKLQIEVLPLSPPYSLQAKDGGRSHYIILWVRGEVMLRYMSLCRIKRRDRTE